MIVLKKDKSLRPVASFDEAQKMVNDGWEVYINKTGKKIIKKVVKKETKTKTKK